MKITTGQLNIAWVGSNFKEWFGEPTVKPKKWKPYSVVLPKYMNDGEIMKEYSPKDITLDELAYLLKSKEGMLTNGYANIFYIGDSAGVLRTVYVYWGVGGWSVSADSVEDAVRWRGGFQVFSRNCFETGKVPESKTLSPSETLSLPNELTINGVIYIRK